jgi:hypothetical protein
VTTTPQELVGLERVFRSPLIYPNILLCHLALFHVLLDSYVRQALHSQGSCMTLLLIHGCLMKEDKIKYTRKNLQGCHSQLVDKLMNCWTITSCWNNSKLLEPQLVTSLLSQQLRNKALTTCEQDGNQQCERILVTSQVGTALLQICCRFVTTCAFLRVHTLCCSNNGITWFSKLIQGLLSMLYSIDLNNTLR